MSGGTSGKMLQITVYVVNSLITFFRTYPPFEPTMPTRETSVLRPGRLRCLLSGFEKQTIFLNSMGIISTLFTGLTVSAGTLTCTENVHLAASPNFRDKPGCKPQRIEIILVKASSRAGSARGGMLVGLPARPSTGRFFSGIKPSPRGGTGRVW